MAAYFLGVSERTPQCHGTLYHLLFCFFLFPPWLPSPGSTRIAPNLAVRCPSVCTLQTGPLSDEKNFCTHKTPNTKADYSVHSTKPIVAIRCSSMYKPCWFQRFQYFILPLIIKVCTCFLYRQVCSWPRSMQGVLDGRKAFGA